MVTFTMFFCQAHSAVYFTFTLPLKSSYFEIILMN